MSLLIVVQEVTCIKRDTEIYVYVCLKDYYVSFDCTHSHSTDTSRYYSLPHNYLWRTKLNYELSFSRTSSLTLSGL